MGTDEVKHGLSRRELLGSAALALVGAALTRGQQATPTPANDAATQPATSQPAKDAPWWMGPDYPISNVVDVHCPSVAEAAAVDEAVLSEMLSHGLKVLTGALTAGAAWKAILGASERILIKCNHVGEEVIGTNGPFVRTLVESLASAGYAPKQLTAVEVPAGVVRELGLARPVDTWGPSIEVDGVQEEIAQYWYAADAVINVPFLKTHRMAGMSGAMKNLSHALIRQPGRHHRNGCTPAVGQVVGNKVVSSRLRLNVVNAIRTVTAAGPEARHRHVQATGRILLGYDPLAVDEVGYGVLLNERRLSGNPDIFDVPYLRDGAARGWGRRAAHEIRRLAVEGAW